MRLGAGQRGDVELLEQPRAQRRVAGQSRGGQHRVHQRGIVARHEPERIAWLIVDPGALERQLDVPGVRGRAAAGEPDALGDLRLERPRPAPGGDLRRRAGEIDVDHRARLRLAELRLQRAQRAVDPGGSRRLVVQVALDPLGDPRRPQRGEAFVEQPAGLAEPGVGAIAQRQHGVAHAIEARRIVGHQRGVEIDRALRRIALAPGAGDHQQVLRAGHLRRRGIRHVEHPRRKAQLAGGLARRIRQRLGVAGLGPEQNGERRAPRRRCRRGRLRRVRRLIAGEEAAQPGPLLGVGAGDDAVQRDDLFGRERRGLRQHGVLLRAAASAPCQAASSGRSATTGPMTISVGACDGMRGGGALRLRQRGDRHALARRRRVGDEGDRFRRVAARRAQTRGDRADLAQRHVEHQHVGAARQGGPVEIGQFAAGVVAGDEGDAVRQAAMRHRDARRCGAADAGADAGDDAEPDAGGGERQRLLPAAAEHQRVAALQPHTRDGLRGPGGSAAR